MVMRLVAGVGLLVGALALAGCATPAKVESMQVSGVEAKTVNASSALRDNVAVDKVIGGEETNPLWTSEISSSGFRQALEASLKNAGLLTPLQSASEYVLEAQLKQVDQPLAGIDMTVTTTVNYVLKERKTGVLIWQGDIVSPYTAAFSEAFLGVERLRVATEGSAKSNISQLIDKLYSLGVKEGSVGG